MNTLQRTRALVERVADLNPMAGEIGAGMLANIVQQARIIVAESRTNLEHVRAELDYTQTREDLNEIEKRRTSGKWFASHAAYSEAISVCGG